MCLGCIGEKGKTMTVEGGEGKRQLGNGTQSKFGWWRIGSRPSVECERDQSQAQPSGQRPATRDRRRQKPNTLAP